MKLYYSPGACSLADHIALHEAGMDFEHERVDLKSKRTEHGRDYREVNPKGYVPALQLDSGEVLTENVAVLDWIAHQSATLKPEGPLGHTRQIEALAYIGGEVHKAFGPMFKGGSDEDKARAKEQVADKLRFLAGRMRGEYLLGDRPGVADFYLFVMLTWAQKQGIDTPEPLARFRDKLMARDSVRTAMEHEGLLKSPS
ncbi:glutathione binding-like protein [Sphingomonas lenta]|uniref:Glutathione S-transferase n=1 Tax=Sphingomonas lenta TaxID=1141887 RepID=A0A2A2SDC7_9SPHN|nr:glutathione binding-like protein [Sphingomonas lenta]PAX07215.1 glutathione S-transferase [Sphingomonas lenta]